MEIFKLIEIHGLRANTADIAPKPEELDTKPEEIKTETETEPEPELREEISAISEAPQNNPEPLDSGKLLHEITIDFPLLLQY